MCTLIALAGVHRDFPLVVAANRDEFYARPSTGPQRLAGDEAAAVVVAGVDGEKGGTWLGASERGFFVGLTNQRSAAPPDPSRRTRGHVVLDALRAPDIDAAVRGLAAVDARAYNGFNLLLGDAQRLYVAYARPTEARIEIAELPAGIWTLPNDRIDTHEFPKVDRAAALAAPLVSLTWDALVPAAQAMLADHELPETAAMPATRPPWLSAENARRLQALCVHTPVYGTRSAALLAISERGLERHLHAAGPPCQAKLQ